MCDNNRIIIGIKKFNSIISHIECWSLEAGDSTITDCGYDAFVYDLESIQYFCIPNAPFTIKSFIRDSLLGQYRLQHTTQGYISILIPTPPFYSQLPTIAATTLSVTEPPITCTVNPVFIINSATIWKYNVDNKCGNDWNKVDFNDTNWPEWHSHNQFFRSSICFRSWFHLDSVSNITNLEFRVFSSSRMIVCLNEDCPIDETLNKKRWGLYTVTPEFIHEGDNLVAFFVIPQNTMESNDYPPGYLRLRLVTETESCSHVISGKATGTNISGFPVANLFDQNMEKLWKSDFVEGKASVTFTFGLQQGHMFNKYCLTNASPQEMDPHSWEIFFFVRQNSMKWIEVDEQEKVTWQSRYQKQCFLISSLHLLAYAVMIKISPIPGQSNVQLTYWEFHYVKRGNMETTELMYPSSSIRAFTEMPIKMHCPVKPYFFNFRISGSLPRGLKLNEGTGCITGKIEKGFQPVTYSIVAQNLRHVSCSVTLHFDYVTCTFPNSPLSLVFEKKQNGGYPFEVEVSIFSSSWIPLRMETVIVNSQSSSVFGQCLEPDSYSLVFADFSNQGNLNVMWLLYQNGYLLRNSLMNPGYTHVWQKIAIKDEFDDENTEWFYHVDSSEVDSDWFKAIIPPTEPWESAIPEKIPPISGIAQYFKTVLYLSDLKDIVSLQFSFRILAGIVFYINGYEYHRFNLPDSKVTSHTAAIDAFPDDVMYTISVPIQYSLLTEGRNVIAVETHLIKAPIKPSRSTFRVRLTYLANYDFVIQNAIAIDITPVGGSAAGTTENVTSVNAIVDHNYYSQYFKESDCKDEIIHIFTDMGQPEFVTQMRFFFGKERGLYPHNLKLYGRLLYSLTEIEMAKKGMELENRKWIELMDVDILMSGSYGLGTKKEINFYNEVIMNEFRIVMNDCEFGRGFEIGELEFTSSRNEGFCNIHNITQEMSIVPSEYIEYVPTRTWYKKQCPELYQGTIDVYCLNGNWTNQRQNCRPLPPVFCRYSVTVWYIGLRKEVSIFPKVKGAEISFLTSNLPEGLMLNSETGEISGIVRHVIPLTEIHVKCVNLGGEIDTVLAVMTVNNHEVVLIVIAGVMIVLFVLMLLGIVKSLKKKSLYVIDESVKNGKLHVDELSEEMRSLLL